MPVKSINLETLIDWLGAEGAVAGLDRGHHTNAELMIIARNNGVIVDSKTARRQIAIEIIMSRLQRIDRNDDELLEMSKDELIRYFTDRMVSRSEINSLLDKLQINPRGKVRSKFVDFASNEISDLGMYQRVAKGHGRAA